MKPQQVRCLTSLIATRQMEVPDGRHGALALLLSGGCLSWQLQLVVPLPVVARFRPLISKRATAYRNENA